MTNAEDSRPVIRRLPAVLANQIAAGEVVERPAAVVKELVENSIDAGARHIRIDIGGGGTELIRVRDDGHGIAADQLALALSRHATSKLAAGADLAAIATLGFRGEALPSIASVARVRLVSRTSSAEHASEVTLAGEASANSDTSGAPEPAVHPVGTTVEVRDLFFNTPARRRFLRAARTEFLHIETAVRRAALARSQVGFELWHGERRVLRASADEDVSSTRLAALVGRKFASSAVWLDESADNMRLRGWLAPIEQARAHSDIQYLCVNGRVVRDPMLRHALRAAHADVLGDERQPAYVLELLVATNAVDVNVHPTKHELRFRDSRQTHDFVVSTVAAALDANPEIAGLDAANVDLGEPTDLYVAESGTGRYQPTSGAYRGASVPPLSGFVAGALPHPLAGGLRNTGRGAASARPGLAHASSPPGGYVLTLAPGFILTRTEARHYVVDVERLAERCVRDALEALDGVVARYPLLLPQAWNMTEAEASILDSCVDDLAHCGLEIRRSAPAQFMLLTVPRVLRSVPSEAILSALSEGMITGVRAPQLPALLAKLAATEAATASEETLQTWLLTCPQDSSVTIWRAADTHELRRWLRA